ncbi:MAG: hypothetical protein JXQ68_04995 [Campylobacterales bacterium]|nr:hypothetical protein [Campylobacterales bacterium]
MDIAQNILDQIRTLDHMAIFAWGTSKVNSIPESEEHLGGLKLLVQNNPKIKERATVEITLNGSDLYDIKVYSDKGLHYDERDLYCGDLVIAIDEALG